MSHHGALAALSHWHPDREPQWCMCKRVLKHREQIPSFAKRLLTMGFTPGTEDGAPSGDSGSDAAPLWGAVTSQDRNWDTCWNTWSNELVVYIVSRQVFTLVSFFNFYSNQHSSDFWTLFFMWMRKQESQWHSQIFIFKNGELVSLRWDTVKDIKITPRFRGREKPWQHSMVWGKFESGQSYKKHNPSKMD